MKDSDMVDRIQLLERRQKRLILCVILSGVILLILLGLLWISTNVTREILAILSERTQMSAGMLEFEKEQDAFVATLARQLQDLIEQLDDQTKVPDAKLRAEVTLLNERVRAMEGDLKTQPALQQKLTDLQEHSGERFQSLEGWIQIATWTVIGLVLSVALFLATMLLKVRGSA